MFTPESEPVTLAWSEDNQMLLTATGTHVVSTSVKSMQTIDQVKLPHYRTDINTGLLVESYFYWAAFQRNGTGIITTGGTPEIHAWRLPSGEKQWTIKIAAKHLRVLAVSPDGHTLACTTTSGDDLQSLRVFDLAERKEMAQFDLGRDRADCLKFSLDGNQVLAGFSDGTALIYDVSNVR
jgi:WD40 repeat protein